MITQIGQLIEEIGTLQSSKISVDKIYSDPKLSSETFYIDIALKAFTKK